MPSVVHSVPDVTTFAANVVVFLAAIAATVAGAMSAVKKIKESWLESNKAEVTVSKSVVIGGMLQDAIGSAMMAEQLRELNTNIIRLHECMSALAHEIELDRVTRNGR